jgi:hypothetical protein
MFKEIMNYKVWQIVEPRSYHKKVLFQSTSVCVMDDKITFSAQAGPIHPPFVILGLRGLAPNIGELIREVTKICLQFIIQSMIDLLDVLTSTMDLFFLMFSPPG